jgi:hypothetical protein
MILPLLETAQSSLDCSVLSKLPGKTTILGVLGLSTHEIETSEIVAGRIRRALPFVSPERLIVAPDCGLNYLPRNVAFDKDESHGGGRSWCDLNSRLNRYLSIACGPFRCGREGKLLPMLCIPRTHCTQQLHTVLPNIP